MSSNKSKHGEPPKVKLNLSESKQWQPGFFLGRLHIGGICIWGGQVQGDKALMGGTYEGGHRPYGGNLTLIDYIIN